MGKFKQNEMGFSAIEAILIFVIVAIIGFMSWYVIRSHNLSNKQPVSNTNQTVSSKGTQQTSSQAFQLPNGWLWYENQQYGFKLAHPSSWGAPNVSQVDGLTGKSYRLSFYPGPAYTIPGSSVASQSRNQIIIGFDSDDYTFSGCKDSGQCTTVGPYTSKKAIEEVVTALNENKYQGTLPVVAHDNNSFTTVNTLSEPGSTHTLEEQQIVLIPNLNISGAFTEYYILNAQADCLKDKISPNSKQWCLNLGVLDSVTKVMNSLQGT